MAIVNSKPMRRVGVGAQYICFWEKEQSDDQIAFAANVTKLKTVASIQTTEERSESKVFGSNEVYDVDTSVTPPKMTVENLAFPPIVLATMRGNEIKNGFVVHSTYDEPGYLPMASYSRRSPERRILSGIRNANSFPRAMRRIPRTTAGRIRRTAPLKSSHSLLTTRATTRSSMIPSCFPEIPIRKSQRKSSLKSRCSRRWFRSKEDVCSQSISAIISFPPAM